MTGTPPPVPAPAPAPRPAPRDRLSREEARTLGLAHLGLSNAEVCEALGLSIRVVNAHLRRARALSGLTRRAEVAAWASAPLLGDS